MPIEDGLVRFVPKHSLYTESYRLPGRRVKMLGSSSPWKIQGAIPYSQLPATGSAFTGTHPASWSTVFHAAHLAQSHHGPMPSPWPIIPGPCSPAKLRSYWMMRQISSSVS